jgi:hypothetical protein
MIRIRRALMFATAALLALIGIATLTARAQDSNDLLPETVMSTYHVQSGHEAEFQELMGHVWQTYRQEKLVFTDPHVLVRSKDAGGNTNFVEVFTWISHSAPDHAPDSVKTLWKQMETLCKRADGKSGIEFSEVENVTPKR